MTEKYRVAILGDGGWGTALAIVNHRRHNEVMLWSAFPDYAKVLTAQRENVKFLKGIPIPSEIQIVTGLKEVLEFAQIVILAIPAQYLRNILYKLKEFDLTTKTLVSVAKGIEKNTCLRPTEIIHSILGNDLPVVVLSGPSHAEEVALGKPALLVAAARSDKDSQHVQKVMIDTRFRIYAQSDVTGVELGGALKNVISIAAGICDGLDYGDNTKAGVITRGLYEIARLGVRLGANPTTFFGLSGLGDLLTTSYSKYGRNLYVGRELGKGRKIDDILKGMDMVAEGVPSAESVHQLSERLHLQLPIMTEIYNIIYRGRDVREAVTALLNREAYDEWRYQPLS